MAKSQSNGLCVTWTSVSISISYFLTSVHNEDLFTDECSALFLGDVSDGLVCWSLWHLPLPAGRLAALQGKELKSKGNLRNLLRLIFPITRLSRTMPLCTGLSVGVDSASTCNVFCQINIIQFKIIHNRVSAMFATQIKSC